MRNNDSPGQDTSGIGSVVTTDNHQFAQPTHELSARVASRVEQEDGVPVRMEGDSVTINNSSGEVSVRPLRAFAETLAQTHSLTVQFDQPDTHHIRVAFSGGAGV